ncbi:MAG: glycosyltransferase [Methylobacteriaceae bacterium]|nr:glycosyltransferase [Methylobacteriaceae bacterium]
MADTASDPLLSLVICTLDEPDAIGAVLREVARVLAPVHYEVLVVDDSADDRTAAIVRAHAAADGRVRLLRRTSERGLASAAIAGFSAARGEILGLMDGDGQHEADRLPQLLAVMREGADFAVASRYVRAGGSGLAGWRDALSRAGTGLTRACLGAPTSDPLSGFFLFRKGWFDAARPKLSGVGFKILIDLLASGERRPRVSEVATALRARTAGQSKLDLRVTLELGALLVEKRSAGLIPARFVLFGAVGGTGVVVHMAALAVLGTGGLSAFWAAQALAIATAMAWNFHLNNALTFRDLRLTGRARWRGLAAFCLGCAGGAALNELTASGLHALGLSWALAGLAGTVLGAVWNYQRAGQATWGAKPAPQSAIAQQPQAAALVRQG